MGDAKIIKSAGKVGLAVMVSRVLGLLRDQVFAYFFGGGRLTDCFQMAFRIPNLLRDLFAEGALSSAFVTVFARTHAKEGDQGAWRLANKVMTFQWVLLGGVSLMGILLAPWLVSWIAPGYALESGKLELTVLMTRVLFPFILFVGMAALCMGVLNTYGRFGLPASASSFFNIGSIVVGLGLAIGVDPSFGEKAMICMAVGSLVGGGLQWWVQMPALRHLGFHSRWDWSPCDPQLRQIGKIMAPALIGVSAVQVNVVINSIFASGLGDGAVTWLAFAFRLIQLPIGIFGVAISTASLPSLSVSAQAGDLREFREKVEKALKLNTALCVPAACGLAVLSMPLVGLLYERGRFDFMATEETSHVLIAYTMGLTGYSSIKVLAPSFYALNRTLIPMMTSLGSIVVTFSLNWFFVKRVGTGAWGLALATSCSAIFSSGVLWMCLDRMMGGYSQRVWKTWGKVGIASGMMTVVVYGVDFGLTECGLQRGFIAYLSRVMVGVTVGVWIYFIAARLVRLTEVSELEKMFRSKMSRWFKKAP